MNTNWIIYLELARDFFTQWGIFRKRTPEEIRTREYNKARKKLDNEAEKYRRQWVSGKIKDAHFTRLMENISTRQHTLRAEHDAD